MATAHENVRILRNTLLSMFGFYSLLVILNFQLREKCDCNCYLLMFLKGKNKRHLSKELRIVHTKKQRVTVERFTLRNSTQDPNKPIFQNQR